MSFFVDPVALLLIGVILQILSSNYNFAKSVTYTLAAATLTSFIFGGIALYLDWYRWVIPGIADLKGSYIILDQGFTGFTKETFPVWLAMMFLTLYPFWFALGFETSKKYQLSKKIVPVLVVGVLLLAAPSIVQSRFLVH